MIADPKVIPESLPYLTWHQGYARTFIGCCQWVGVEVPEGTRYTCKLCRTSYLWPKGRVLR